MVIKNWKLSLIVLPAFLIVALLSWLKLFPLGGSRHALFLLFYLLLPIAFLLNRVSDPQSWQQGKERVLSAAVVLVSVGLAGMLYSAAPLPTHLPEWEQIVSRHTMAEVSRTVEDFSEELVVLCDEQTFQLLTPLLQKRDQNILFGGKRVVLASDATYRFKYMSDLVDGLTNSLKTRSLLVLSQWGRSGVITELDDVLQESTNGETLVLHKNVGVFLVSPEVVHELKNTLR